MFFALVLIPAAAGIIKGSLAGIRHVQAGRDLKKSKQATFSPMVLSKEEWDKLGEDAQQVVLRGQLKHQLIELEKRRQAQEKKA